MSTARRCGTSDAVSHPDDRCRSVRRLVVDRVPGPDQLRGADANERRGAGEFLVSNTPRHLWRLERWHELFPDAQLWAPRSTPVTLRHSMLPPTGTLQDRPIAAWAEDLDQVVIRGSRFIEEVCFLHKRSRTLIVGDLIQVHDLRLGQFFANALKRAVGVAAPDGGTSADIRASFWNRKALRASVQRLLDWSLTTWCSPTAHACPKAPDHSSRRHSPGRAPSTRGTPQLSPDPPKPSAS